MIALPRRGPPIPPQLQAEGLALRPQLKKTEVIVPGRNGKLAVYEAGGKHSPVLVMLPPNGVSYEVMMPLATWLSGYVRVIAIGSRGCPDISEPWSSTFTDQSNQVRDLNYALDFLNVHEYALVAWCQSAQLAASLAGNGVGLIDGLVLLSPSGFNLATAPSEFEKHILPLYLRVAKNGISDAEKVLSLLAIFKKKSEKAADLHLKSCESLYRFSCYTSAFREVTESHGRALAEKITRCRTLLIHPRDDEYSHVSESINLAKEIHSAELNILEGGGHFIFFETPELIGVTILSFLGIKMT